jgi:hypothetical protein
MLDEILRIAFSFGILVGGWFLSRRKPGIAKIITRSFLAVIVALLALLAITGIQHATQGELHRWTGHGLTIVVWLWFVCMLGEVWGRRWPHHFGAILGLSMLLVVCVSLGFLASITGFLGPSHRNKPSEQEMNRFIVLHQFALPFLFSLSLAVIGWWEAR